MSAIPAKLGEAGEPGDHDAPSTSPLIAAISALRAAIADADYNRCAELLQELPTVPVTRRTLLQSNGGRMLKDFSRLPAAPKNVRDLASAVVCKWRHDFGFAASSNPKTDTETPGPSTRDETKQRSHEKRGDLADSSASVADERSRKRAPLQQLEHKSDVIGGSRGPWGSNPGATAHPSALHRSTPNDIKRAKISAGQLTCSENSKKFTSGAANDAASSLRHPPAPASHSIKAASNLTVSTNVQRAITSGPRTPALAAPRSLANDFPDLKPLGNPTRQMFVTLIYDILAAPQLAYPPEGASPSSANLSESSPQYFPNASGDLNLAGRQNQICNSQPMASGFPNQHNKFESDHTINPKNNSNSDKSSQQSCNTTLRNGENGENQTGDFDNEFSANIDSHVESPIHYSKKTVLKVVTKLELALYTKHNADVSQSYRDDLRRLYSNLKLPDNGPLRQAVLAGTIEPQRLVRMTPAELAPERLKMEMAAIKEKNMHNARAASNIKASTDQFRCGKCRQRRTSYYQMQTRSADEPMTTFVECLNCGNHWKF